MIFLDSNIWLYGYSMDADISKRTRALELAVSPDVCLSSQVVNEVMSNILRKQLGTEPFVQQLIEELYADYPVLEILREDIRTASMLRESYRFSYWDSLIVATALRSHSEILYSEDMQDGLVVQTRLVIRNPFVS